MTRLEEECKAYAVMNALKYGKAAAKPILGKILATHPEERSAERREALLKLIEDVVEEVNRLPRNKLEELARNLSTLLHHTREEKKSYEVALPPLPSLSENKEAAGSNKARGTKSVVVTRFAPEPSGYLHLGHAKAAFLSYVAAKERGGVFRLRFDDTNPKLAKTEYEAAIKGDLQWLGIEPNVVSHTSDYLELLYAKARQLIEAGRAYVCTCPSEKIRELRQKGKPCPHRNQDPEEALELFDKMISGHFKEGQAVLRYKGELSSPNTAMRDPTLMRIIEAEHYRLGNKFTVWPSYDFAAPVVDAEEGVTYAIRSKEYELRAELYHRILKDLGYGDIVLIHISRLKAEGYLTSKRKIRELVLEGKLMGWDDPRLLTLRALRRRGMQPLAIKRFALSFGLGKQENKADLSLLFKENRKLLDSKANRYFFVEDPVKVSIQDDDGVLPKLVKLKKHPSRDEYRTLPLSTGEGLFISRRDWENFVDGEIIRLKDLANAIVRKADGKTEEKGKEGRGPVLEITGGEHKGLPKIQWVPANFAVEAGLTFPLPSVDKEGNFIENSLEIKRGYAEKNVLDLKPREVIQFERMGFFALDKKEPLTFIFSS